MRTIESIESRKIKGFSIMTSDDMLNLLPENEEELKIMQQFKRQVIAEVLEKFQNEINHLKKY